MVYVVARVTKATRTVPRTTVPALTCGETERVRQHRIVDWGCWGVPVRRTAERRAQGTGGTRADAPGICVYRVSPEISSPPTSRPPLALLERPLGMLVNCLDIEKRIPRRAAHARTRRRLSRSGLGKRPGAGRHAAEERRPEGCRAAKAGGVQAEEGSGGSLEIRQIARGAGRRGVRGDRCVDGDARCSG